MYTVFPSKRFSKSLKKILRSGNFSRREIEKVIVIIASGQKLESKYKEHKLKGEFREYHECHIRPDLLLVYHIQKDKLVLLLIDIGSHSYLFK